MATITKPIVLDETMKELLQTIESVRFVNGMTGNVVLDGRNLKINASNSGSQTIAQAFAKSGKASVSRIVGIVEDDYILTITNGFIN